MDPQQRLLLKRAAEMWLGASHITCREAVISLSAWLGWTT